MANAVEKLNTIAILDIEKVNTLTDDNIEKITTLEFVGDVIGEQSYTSAGSYTWVVPAGVTLVHVVSVQEGETPLVSSGATDHGGGKGGDLRYQNNITVTPSSSIAVVVGLTPTFNGSALTTLGGSGGAHRTGDGNYGAAGSGAGGYAGDGGQGLSTGNAPPPTTGDGPPDPDSGAASAGYAGTQSEPPCGGGGVGLFGIGATGAPPLASGTGDYQQGKGGRGGSGGANGRSGWFHSDSTGNPGTTTGTYYSGDHWSGGGDGGDYGGGGAAEWDRNNKGSGAGGSGAIRIIWGTGRSFPSNAAAV